MFVGGAYQGLVGVCSRYGYNALTRGEVSFRGVKVALRVQGPRSHARTWKPSVLNYDKGTLLRDLLGVFGPQTLIYGGGFGVIFDGVGVNGTTTYIGGRVSFTFVRYGKGLPSFFK